jgi:hypothetical protein
MLWSSTKQELVKAGKLNNLFAVNADQNALVALEEVQNNGSFTYQPLLFNTWFRDAAKLADRVLAYRREARELEVLAVKAAMDHQLAESLLEIDRDIQKLHVGKEVKHAAQATQQTAATRFTETGDTYRGFQALAEGRANELGLEIRAADQELSLIDQKFQVQRPPLYIWPALASPPAHTAASWGTPLPWLEKTVSAPNVVP